MRKKLSKKSFGYDLFTFSNRHFGTLVHSFLHCNLSPNHFVYYSLLYQLIRLGLKAIYNCSISYFWNT